MCSRALRPHSTHAPMPPCPHTPMPPCLHTPMPPCHAPLWSQSRAGCQGMDQLQRMAVAAVPKDATTSASLEALSTFP